MRELTPEQLQEKFPNGWRAERKVQRLSNGEVREYVCRRARKPPAARQVSQKVKLMRALADVSEERAGELLQLIQ